MYVPKHFEVTDRDVLFDFAASHSFATLVTSVEGSLFATHLPLLLDREQGKLYGHVAVGNKHHRSFDGETEALAIFAGPHAYVSPTWYVVTPAVPTWNYTTVHIHGRPKVIDDEAWLSRFVDQLTAVYDPEYAAATTLPEDFKARLLKGIVGFEMSIERVEGKYKLSQNRSPEDIQGVLENLDSSVDPVANALARFTREHLGINGRVEQTSTDPAE